MGPGLRRTARGPKPRPVLGESSWLSRRRAPCRATWFCHQASLVCSRACWLAEVRALRVEPVELAGCAAAQPQPGQVRAGARRPRPAPAARRAGAPASRVRPVRRPPAERGLTPSRTAPARCAPGLRRVEPGLVAAWRRRSAAAAAAPASSPSCRPEQARQRWPSRCRLSARCAEIEGPRAAPMLALAAISAARPAGCRAGAPAAPARGSPRRQLQRVDLPGGAGRSPGRPQPRAASSSASAFSSRAGALTALQRDAGALGQRAGGQAQLELGGRTMLEAQPGHLSESCGFGQRAAPVPAARCRPAARSRPAPRAKSARCARRCGCRPAGQGTAPAPVPRLATRPKKSSS